MTRHANEMQLAGWIGTTPIPGMSVPGWAGTWFSVFPNIETIAAQLGSIALVLGSYVGAQYLRVWRPQRRRQQVATRAESPPEPSRPESSRPKSPRTESPRTASPAGTLP
jgi:hypothetical protein